jgi:hypothetical protein
VNTLFVWYICRTRIFRRKKKKSTGKLETEFFSHPSNSFSIHAQKRDIFKGHKNCITKPMLFKSLLKYFIFYSVLQQSSLSILDYSLPPCSFLFVFLLNSSDLSNMSGYWFVDISIFI